MSGLLLIFAVFLLSASALAAEVLLMRLLSIADWHHFAWMVISLALLGYAAAGTAVALARRVLLRRLRMTLALSASFSGIALLVAVSLAGLTGFNSLEILWRPSQLLRLFALYVSLSLPFFAVAVFLSTLFAAARASVASLYRSDLLGAGFGAAAAVALLFALPLDAAIRAVAASCGVAALLVAAAMRRRRFGAIAAAVALLLAFTWPSSLLRPRMSPYKALSQAMRIPGARIVLERSGPQGVIDVVANDVVPFRYAPGLSLAYPGEIPQQLLLFVDGSIVTALPTQTSSYTDYTTAAAGPALRRIEGARVLVIGADAPAIADSIRRGVGSIDVAERNGRLAALLENELAAGAPYLARHELTVHPLDARAMLQHARQRWLLIEMNIGEQSEGALRENDLLTVESMALLRRRLETRGLISITTPMHAPPNEVMKLITTAAASGIRRDSIAVVRSWSTATVLLSESPFTQQDLDALEAFATARSFDIDVPSHAARPRFNALDHPWIADAANAAFGGSRTLAVFLRAWKFDVSPARDDRPFFFHFFRWRAFPELLALRARGGAALIQSGYLVAVVGLLQAIGAAALIVLLPLAIDRRRRHPDGGWRMPLYFSSIAVGFMIIEIAFLQTFTFVFAHPLYAASLVLGSFLVCAGIGSGIARRFAQTGGQWPRAILLTIALLALLEAATLRLVLVQLAPAADAVKVVLSVLLISPLAVLMGMPFPLGLLHFGSHHRSAVPWAWAINGSASVVAAVAAMLLALSWGIRAAIVTAAGLYAAAALPLRRR